MEESEARPYQLELLDAALEQNTIVHLGTGAGKTFIAVMLIRELSPQVLKPFSESDGQRSVFLVPSVPLVEQQAGYIRMHTLLNVGEYIGEMGVDYWPRRKWHQEFEGHQVLVMTMTIFKNLLASGYIPPKKVNLVVFDECHHATKNHDYVQIMKQVNKLCETSKHEIPRILGLSASIVPNKPKSGDIERSIKELEETLSCRVETARDLQNVAEYVSNPDEMILHYNSKVERADILRQVLEEPLDFLNLFSKSLKNDLYKLLKPFLEDCHHVLGNLGVWCANAYARDSVNRLIEAYEPRAETEWERSLLQLCWTHLKIFCEKSRRKLEKCENKLACTSKVEALLLHLADSAIQSGEVCEDSKGDERVQSSRLLGIVFVERRTTAEYLCKVVKRKVNSNRAEDVDLKHIRCDYIVGHSDMNVKKQTGILEQFRRQKLNLLFSTSVVEEGLDVPKCNLVVRFDFPQNLPSYIQSKGRARAKDSIFLVLIDRREAEKIERDLHQYQSLEDEFKAICLDRIIPSEEEILKRMEDYVEPYMPGGKDGPIALLSSSLSLVHRYCQKLPSDRYAILAPDFSYEVRGAKFDCFKDEHAMDATPAQCDGDERTFKCVLALPMNSPVHDPIAGVWMPTKRTAQKSAALEAVKRLHEAGELKDDLKPLDRSDFDSEGEEDEMDCEEDKHTGTERSSDYYPNEVAEVLTASFPKVGAQNHLYIVLVRDATTGRLHHSFCDQGPHTAFGILTSSELPHLKIPEFSLYENDSELHVKVVEYHHTNVSVSEEELSILIKCHHMIFTEILRIRPSWLEIDYRNSAKNYLIVPLGILPHFNPVEAFIDLPLAEKVACFSSSELAKTSQCQWPCALENYSNALVSKTYMNEEQNKVLFEVQSMSTVTVESPFPDEKYSNFAEYFDVKYDVKLTDLSQPSFICKPHSASDSRLKLLTSRFKSNQGDSLQQKSQPKANLETLFPEICRLYPLPADLWKIARCLPSALWRIECTLLVDDLRSMIAVETGIGIQSDGSEIITHTNLRGYEDHGFGKLRTLHLTKSDSGDAVVSELESLANLSVCLRGPDNALFLQALTSAGAMDSINLERLETLGDSFLKLATTIFLLYDRPSAHEGRLTSARSRRIGNRNLFKLAIKRNIVGKICSQRFEPRQMWIPPCFAFNEHDSTVSEQSSSGKTSTISRHYQSHKVTDKGVADTVESLIGAYLVSGGIEAAIKFMKWMGIKIVKSNRTEEVEMLSDDGIASSSSSSDSCNSPKIKRPKLQSDCPTQSESLKVFFQKSPSLFTKYFGSFSEPKFTETHQREIKKLLDVSMGPCDIEGQIKWIFQDPSLLLQAVTHASYSRNRVTGSYQRLEFLGDAVLDYLVTCHIYSTFPKYGPGEISGMRSALVNNITFAELAVKLRLDKALLHNSPSLFRHIQDYVTALQSVSGQPADSGEDDGTPQGAETETIEALCNEQLDESQSATVPEIDPDDATDVPSTEDMHPGDYDDEIEELDPPKVLGDVLESLAGAVFLDSGMSLEAVWSVFQPHFDEKIKGFKGSIPVPPIQELLQKEPSAKAERTGSRGRRARYTVTVVNRGIKVSALASTPKAAKMAAAKAALARLHKLD